MNNPRTFSFSCFDDSSAHSSTAQSDGCPCWCTASVSYSTFIRYKNIKNLGWCILWIILCSSEWLKYTLLPTPLTCFCSYRRPSLCQCSCSKKYLCEDDVHLPCTHLMVAIICCNKVWNIYFMNQQFCAWFHPLMFAFQCAKPTTNSVCTRLCPVTC